MLDTLSLAVGKNVILHIGISFAGATETRSQLQTWLMLDFLDSVQLNIGGLEFVYSVLGSEVARLKWRLDVQSDGLML